MADESRPVGGRDYPRTHRLLQQALDTDPHPLKEVGGGTGADWDDEAAD